MIAIPSTSRVIEPEDQALSVLDQRLMSEGSALASLIIQSADDHQNTLFRVLFKEGSMSAWHSHPKGQILVIVRGECVVEFSTATKIAKAGSVVWIEPNVIHRHGSRTGEMEYISIQQILGGTATEWLPPSQPGAGPIFVKP